MTPSTRQFNEACIVKWSRPPASSAVRTSMPHHASASPSAPPMAASSTLSVSNWRITRQRSAPMLSLTAISRRRAAARVSSRFAMFAQAISRIRPTIVMSTSDRLRVVPPQAVEAGRAACRSVSADRSCVLLDAAVALANCPTAGASCGLGLRRAARRASSGHDLDPIEMADLKISSRYPVSATGARG